MNPYFCSSRVVVVIVALSLRVWGAPPGAQSGELDQAFRYLETYTWGQSREPLNAIEAAIQSSAGDPDALKQLENRLAAVLRTAAPFPARQYAAHKLSQIGTADSIPVLVPLLVDAALSHPARMALQRIPDPRAMEALRRALPQAEGNAKLGIINSLGVLRDASAVGLLVELLANPDARIAGAAALALGHIATVEAARALEQSRNTAPKPLQAGLIDAWLIAAGRLLQAGQRPEAARIFAQLHTRKQTDAVRLAAFKGLVAAEPERAFDLLASAIAGDDEQERHVAARILGDGSAARDVKRFVDSFQTYSPAAQVALLEVFRSRHEAAARPAALVAAESSDTPLRLAGLRALTTVGAAADVPMLARRAAGQGEQKTIARAALASLPGTQVDDAILEKLPAGSPEISVELLNALVARGTEGAGQGAVACLTDPSELVRTAALKTLAELGGAGQVAAVVASLKAATNDSGREAAQSALAAVAGRVGSESVNEILKGLEGASIECRLALLRTLGNAGGPEALAAVRAALADADGRARESAFRVLADWSSFEAAPELLRLARTSAERNWRVLAFRGYIRLCREADSPPEARLRLLAEGMRTASDAEEKRLVIAALGEQNDPQALQILGPCFEDPALAQETCLAVVTFAAKAASGAQGASRPTREKSEMLPCLRQVLRVSTSQEVREKARTILQRLEEKTE